MEDIIEAQNLPIEDKVYLKKDWLGWRIVHPIRNEDGSFSWLNFLVGGWRNLIILIILVTFLIWIQIDLHNKLEVYVEKCDMAMKEPVKFCDSLGYFDALIKVNRLQMTEDFEGLSLTIP